MIAALLILLQAAPPTVGDTVWLRRFVPAAPARALEARPLESEAELFDVLGPPVITRAGGTATLSWPVVFWVSGRQEVTLPAVLLTGADGRVDSVPPQPIAVQVATVLPTVRDSQLAPQPAASFVRVVHRAWWPPALAVLLAGLAAWLIWREWHRRRVGRSGMDAVTPAFPPVERWARAGETRAVAHSAAEYLRAAAAAALPEAHQGLDTERFLAVVAARRPGWPVEDLAGCLRRLDLLRFGPDGTPHDPVALWSEARTLAGRLVEAAA